MRWLASGLLGLVLVATGCLGLLGPEPAPLPPDGEVFTVVAIGCGMQLTAHESVWATYPDGSLYHFTVAVEDNGSDQEDRQRGDVRIPYQVALGILEQASATGAFDLAFYERESRQAGFETIDLWHAERVVLGDAAFGKLREAVTRADLAEREGQYTEPYGVSDGCGIDLAAWTDDGYVHVYRTTKNGPEAVKALDELHTELHPRP